jgi:hypothetical protein
MRLPPPPPCGCLWGDVSAARSKQPSRHCEERSDEAIHSSWRRHGLLRGACHRAALCADPLARNDGKKHLRILAAHSARGLQVAFALKRLEGAGNAGCALHPRSRVQWQQEVRTRAYRAAESIRHSLRNGFAAYNALSPVIGFLATVVGGLTHRLDASTEASGPHAFGGSICRLGNAGRSRAAMSAYRGSSDLCLEWREVRNGPRHKVAALQPAAREQEPRGR